MRLLVSVRCESASIQTKQIGDVAEFVSSIIEAAVRTDDVFLVFDAALGDWLEVIRHAVPALQPQRTQVWGGVGDAASILTRPDIRAVRFPRCIAELEPEAMIDLCIGAPAGSADRLLSLLPAVSVVDRPNIDETAVTVHAVSTGRLDEIRDRFGFELAGLAIVDPARGQAVQQSGAREGVRSALQPLQPDGDADRSDARPNSIGGVRRASGHYLLAPGPGLDATIKQMLRKEGVVQARDGVLQALSSRLSLDTTLQLAFACGGYALLRRSLQGEALPASDVEAWLASVSRGRRTVAEVDHWHEARVALDAALVRCLGEERSVPEVATALRSDILGAVAGPRRLLVDISALFKFDAKSGIQRVVRNILAHLEEALPARYQIVPIAFMDDGRALHASRFYARFVGLPYDIPDDVAFIPRPGDIFLGLDLSAHIVPIHRAKFEWMRRLGIPLHFVVYDLLPMRRPECFDPRVVDLFRAWYAAVADLADGVLCISRAVADEFADWLDEYRPHRIGALDIGYFHLGADIVDAAHRGTDTTHPVDGRRYALMVSTLEPRKGYVQALAAFEVLWARGIDFALVIVGKQGWMMEAFVQRLREHPELGRRLHWFEGIDDALLASLYHHSDVLLSASEGEGFGLPLIEAAQYGVPVLCRDLPVFREIAGDAATYFSGYEPDALAEAVEHWLMAKDARPFPQIPWKTWREATFEFVSSLTAEQPYRRWAGTSGERHVFSGYNLKLHTLVGERSRGDIVTTGREGVLVYGPYASLAAGTYRILVHGEMPDGQAGAMVVEVVAMQSSFQAAAWQVTGAKRGLLVSGAFHLANDVDDLEVRLLVSSGHDVRLAKIEILRDSPRSDTISTIENPGNSEERVQ